MAAECILYNNILTTKMVGHSLYPYRAEHTGRHVAQEGKRKDRFHKLTFYFPPNQSKVTILSLIHYLFIQESGH